MQVVDLLLLPRDKLIFGAQLLDVLFYLQVEVAVDLHLRLQGLLQIVQTAGGKGCGGAP